MDYTTIAQLETINVAAPGIDVVEHPTTGKPAYRVAKYSDNGNGWWLGDTQLFELFDTLEEALIEQNGGADGVVLNITLSKEDKEALKNHVLFPQDYIKDEAQYFPVTDDGIPGVLRIWQGRHQDLSNDRYNTEEFGELLIRHGITPFPAKETSNKRKM